MRRIALHERDGETWVEVNKYVADSNTDGGEGRVGTYGSVRGGTRRYGAVKRQRLFVIVLPYLRMFWIFSVPVSLLCFLSKFTPNT